MKVCTKCKETKGLEEFNKNSKAKDGRDYKCKKCKKEYQKKYRQNNRDKIAEKAKKYQQNNRDKIAERKKKYDQKNKVEIAEYGRKYRQKNKDKIAEKAKKYQQNNRDKIAEYGRKYRQKNPYQTQAYSLSNSARNRTKKKNIPIDFDFISTPNMLNWLKRQPRCECCNVEFDIGIKNGKGRPPNSPSLDRFYPEKGYVKGNVFLICGRCNILKRDATVKELETIVAWMKQNNI